MTLRFLAHSRVISIALSRSVFTTCGPRVRRRHLNRMHRIRGEMLRDVAGQMAGVESVADSAHGSDERLVDARRRELQTEPLIRGTSFDVEFPPGSPIA